MSKVCQELNVSASSIYYRRTHPKHSWIDSEEKDAVEEIFFKHFGNFGRRVIHKELKKKGINISEYKINKILKSAGLKSKYGRKKTKNIHTHPETSEKYIKDNRYPMLTEGERKKEIWSMDFTEENIKGKKVISCGIIGVNNKVLCSLIVGCKNNKETACAAIKLGIEKYGKPYMVMTDRGSPFVSKDFKDLLEKENIIHSMSRAHTPVDNRFIETFWKSMKTEIGPVDDLTVEEYKQMLEFYAFYYNHIRPHSSLGYCVPIPLDI